MPNSFRVLICPSSHISARQVKYSGRRPPVPGDVPASSSNKASFNSARLSTHFPLGRRSGRGRPLSGYFASICAITFGSLISAIPLLEILLTAFPICPLASRDNDTAFFFSLSFSTSTFAFFLPILLLSSCLARVMSLTNRSSKPPQSPLTR